MKHYRVQKDDVKLFSYNKFKYYLYRISPTVGVFERFRNFVNVIDRPCRFDHLRKLFFPPPLNNFSLQIGAMSSVKVLSRPMKMNRLPSN